MSQIIKPLTSGSPIPPNIPTTFQGQNSGVNDGSATPSTNTINFNATSVTTNNNSGIEVAASGSTVTYELTNRIMGTATTSDGVTPTNVFTFNLGATPGSYLFTSKLVVFDTTGNLSAAYSSQASVRTNGAVGTLLDTGNFFVSEETGLEALDLENSVTGNTLQLNVTGLAGKIIHYRALTEYLFVS